MVRIFWNIINKKDMENRMKIIQGGITAAKGFEAAGVEANIKYKNRMDMALVYSKTPCIAAGVFTQNIVKAAPVLWDKDVVTHAKEVHAIIINSGIANACTGKEGYAYCLETAQKASEGLQIEKESVLVASTGVIGMQLPMNKMVVGMEALFAKKEASILGGHDAACAIMTTDTVSKEVAITFTVAGRQITMGGMCKGSGMIHPNMCTMLGFITTDLAISKELLQKALSENVKDTFNMVSIDGDTSTNDTLLLLANGEAGNEVIQTEGEEYLEFVEALRIVNTTLSRKIASDGEGATALFETKVLHAKTKEEARILSKAVICSSLTKAAIFGHDANWGRIICALGYSGVQFDPEKIELFFMSDKGSMQIYKDGKATDYSEEEATKILSSEEVTVVVDMKMGDKEATAWGCDLSYEYVKINADYRT